LAHEQEELHSNSEKVDSRGISACGIYVKVCPVGEYRKLFGLKASFHLCSERSILINLPD
jgi:hypothetical protein